MDWAKCRIVLAGLWLGNLLTVALMAQAMFSSLPDRAVAGMAAGAMFRWETGISLACAIAFSVALWFDRRSNPRHTIMVGIRTLAVLFILAELLGLRPQMAAAKLAGDMAQFGLLHGASGILFVGQGICAAILLHLSFPRRA